MNVKDEKAESLDGLGIKINKLAKEYAEIAYCHEGFIRGKTHIPVSGKVLGSLELENMVDVYLDGRHATGRFNSKFEERVATFLVKKHLLSVNSDSSANRVAFCTLTSLKLGERALKKDDEVIGVAANFPTTVNPNIKIGALRVFGKHGGLH